MRLNLSVGSIRFFLFLCAVEDYGSRRTGLEAVLWLMVCDGSKLCIGYISSDDQLLNFILRFMQYFIKVYNLVFLYVQK